MFNSILGLKKKEEETDNSTTTLALPSVPSENEENSTEKRKKSNWFGWSTNADASSCVVENLHIPVASQEDYLPKHLKLMCRDCDSIRLGCVRA